jgi:hypothetical protein
MKSGHCRLPLICQLTAQLSTGFPHVLSQGHSYDGYALKKGTILHPDSWAIMRQPSLYPSPEIFNPDRWLSNTYPPCASFNLGSALTEKLNRGTEPVQGLFFHIAAGEPELSR